jgi:hypothetical protein
MSTINRIQVANFLNLNGEGEQDPWAPRYRVVTFNFHGQSTAMNMTNGVGKTSNVEAWLALLTRDQELISRTRRKMAPERDGYYSHIRIELRVPTSGNAAQEDLFVQQGSPAAGKETWVFGMYGYRSAGSISFYYYRGSFEQVPIGAGGSAGVALSLLPNQQFRAALKAADRRRHHPSREDWIAELSLHVSPVSMRRQAEYQKRGGGDKSAELFALKSRKGERYDVTFFYEVIAPELLSGLMDQEGEEGEHEFEDTVLNAVMDVIRTRHNTQRKKHELDKVAEVLGVLDQTAAKVKDAQQAQQHYRQKRALMARDVGLLHHLVRNQALPGIPLAVAGDSVLARLKASVIIEPGEHSYRLLASGIGLLTGEAASKLAQRADRAGPEGRRIAQAIVVPVIHRAPMTTGRKPVSYSAEVARELIEAGPQWAKGMTRSLAIEQLDDLETWFLNQAAHRNPYRTQRNELGYDIEQAGRDRQENQKQLDTSRARLSELQDQKTRMDADEAAYRDIQASGEFTEQEWTHPADTAKQVDDEHREARQQYSTFLTEKGWVEKQRPHWDNFVRHYPDADDPEPIHRQHEQALQRATEVLDELRRQHRDADDEGRELQRELTTVDRAVTEHRNEAARFERLSDDLSAYADEFGDEAPHGLERRVVQEQTQAGHERDETHKAIASNQRMLDDLNRFRSETGASIPADWLNDMAERRARLQARKPVVEQERHDLQRQRRELDQQQVAAGPAARQAQDHLDADNIATLPLHQAIEQMTLTPDRRRELLSCFSALLFAPVAADLEQARAAAECLARHDAQVPVFMADALERLAKQGELSGHQDGRFYHDLIAGVSTRAVECLLDPALVEREKQRLEDRIEELAREQGEIERQLKATAEGSPRMRLARKAQQAIDQDAEAGIERLRAQLLTLQAKLPALTRRASEDMLQAIRAANEFARLGGEAKRSQVLDALQRQERLLTDLEQRLQHNKTLLKTLRGQQVDAEQERKQAYPPDLQDLLKRAGEFVQLGGVEFLRSADEREARLQQAVQRSEQRKEYRQLLLRAAAWLEARQHEQDGVDINDRIARHQGEVKQREADIRRLETELARLNERSKPLDDAIKAIDQAAYAAQQHYLPAAAVADELAEELAGDLMARVQSHPIYEQAEALRVVVEQQAAPAQVIAEAEALREQLDELQIDKDLRSLDGLHDEAVTKQRQFLKAVQGAAGDEGLSEVEQQRLQAITDLDSADRVVSMARDIRAIFDREQALYQQASSAETESRALVTQRISYFIEAAQDNLDLFRRVARQRHGGEQAHFQVSADMIAREESEALIENIIIALDDEEAARGKRRRRGMENSENDDQYRSRLRDMIRQNTYRRIFKTPSVKYVSPQIRNDDRPRPLTRSLSSGQRTAMTLQWIIRLADFAISREVQGSITRVSARKRARERAQSILFVDGLFSDLSDEHLIREAMSGIRNTRGRFQLIGLIHNDKYTNDFDVFPVLLLGKVVTSRDGEGGWVSVDERDIDSEALKDTVQVAELRKEIRPQDSAQ